MRQEFFIGIESEPDLKKFIKPNDNLTELRSVSTVLEARSSFYLDMEHALEIYLDEIPSNQDIHHYDAGDQFDY